jgi:hypothetical protein
MSYLLMPWLSLTDTAASTTGMGTSLPGVIFLIEKVNSTLLPLQTCPRWVEREEKYQESHPH